MIVLDTNVISSLMQSNPDPVVVDWLDTQAPESIWTTSVSVFEILYGLYSMPTGKRRQALMESFTQTLEKDMEGRVLLFDVPAARESATLGANLRAAGQPVEIRDVQIAGIVIARHGILATRNIKHFIQTGLSLISPWDSPELQ